MNLTEIALAYLDYGLRPIPLNREGQPNPAWKRPDLKKIPSWEPYQKRPPTEAEITAWFEDEKANIGSVIPQGMVIVDLDGGEEHGHQGAKAAEALLNQAGVVIPEDAPRVMTGNGYQIYLRAPKDWPKIPGEKFLSTNGKKPFVEILTNGSYGILPPSTHPSGRQYAWAVSPDGPIPQAPQGLLAMIEAHFTPQDGKTLLGPSGAQNQPDWVDQALKGAEWGSIDNTAAKLAGYFINRGLSPEATFDIMAATFAKRCTRNGQPTPMERKDLLRVVNSISRGDAQRNGQDKASAVHIKTVGRDFLANLKAGPGKFYTSSIDRLDYYLCGGFQGGELTYLGARPGVGKTALALQMARGIAEKNTTVLIISREMKNAALMLRMVAQNSPIPASQLRRANLGPEDVQRAAATVDKLSSLPIYMSDSASTIESVREMVENSQARHSGLMLIVDYLQIMSVKKAASEKRIQVEAASKGLKNMALDFNIPVICMSSLARNPDKKNKDHEPGLDSLRESGELEHDADIVLFLYRKFNSCETKLAVKKNRNGHLGDINLHFHSDHLIFNHLEDSEEAPLENDERYGS